MFLKGLERSGSSSPERLGRARFSSWRRGCGGAVVGGEIADLGHGWSPLAAGMLVLISIVRLFHLIIGNV